MASTKIPCCSASRARLPEGLWRAFHNDNSLAVLRDIPSLVVGVPARADDALAMYRTAHALCRQAGRVVVMVEPIALYHRRDLRSMETAVARG